MYMARTWVLHTETKGTGAQMVPLESVEKRSPVPERAFVLREPTPRAEPDSTPTAPRRFKVVDVMTREPLVDGAGARATVDALKEVRSIVDVNVYVWQEDQERWRLLSLGEQRAIWDLARAGPAGGPAGR
jgi:hypothetical protein